MLKRNPYRQLTNHIHKESESHVIKPSTLQPREIYATVDRAKYFFGVTVVAIICYILELWV